MNVVQFHKSCPKPKIALVVPMTSLRKTMKKVFGQIKGLSSSMVIGPSEAAKEVYDILRASCSIPILSPTVQIGEHRYCDIGIAESFMFQQWVEKSEADLHIFLQNSKYYIPDWILKKLNYNKFVMIVNPQGSEEDKKIDFVSRKAEEQVPQFLEWAAFYCSFESAS
jgi:predicted acylesterase/phospholipase RssA